MKIRIWQVDGALATLFAAACAWMSRVSGEQAAMAARRYGHNVDSGVLEHAIALVFLGPVALLFALAALADARGWRLRRFIHGCAVLALVCPVAYEVAVNVSA
jgi:hypothetical protein